MTLGISNFLIFLRDTIVPPRKTERVVCGLTLEDLNALSLRSLGGGGLPYQDERVRALVWEIKYYANARSLDLIAPLLAEVLMDIASESLGKPLLIPIPMHPKRRKIRGHNQTELLAEAALKHLGDIYEYAPNYLVRVKNSEPQQGLPAHKRMKNVSRSMEVMKKEKIKGRVCVVLDDVMTTGATLDEAERALKRAGAARVERIALAHS